MDIARKLKRLREERGFLPKDNVQDSVVAKRPWGLDGVVLIGPYSLGEALEGISVGFGMLPERRDWSNKTDEVNDAAQPVEEQPLVAHPTANSEELAQLSPPLTMVPFRWYIGWSTVLHRAWSFFVDYKLIDEMGYRALAVAYDMKRPVTDSDFAHKKVLTEREETPYAVREHVTWFEDDADRVREKFSSGYSA
jgi:hypothetical protein